MQAPSERESPKRPFETRVRRFQNVVVVWPPDEICLSSIQAFRRALIQAGEEKCHIVIEMSRVSYVAAIGVRELLAWARRCAERKLQVVVAAPDRSIGRLLRILDPNGLVQLVPSLDAALARFRD